MIPDMKSQMGGGQMPQQEDSSQMSDDDQSKSSKLLALQNLLGSIAELSGDDMRPYIEQAQQSLHLAHESEEGDDMGVDDAQEASSDKPAMDISVGMGAPGMDSSKSDEEDDGKPKGFLAILAKKVAKH
jgi:hypothetical protein